MKSYGMLKLPLILLGFGGALILSPACKAQDSSPDHFTDTGVQDVYQPAPHQVAAAMPTPAPKALQTRNHQTASPTTVQVAATRSSSAPVQPSALAIPEKRKIAARKPEKP